MVNRNGAFSSDRYGNFLCTHAEGFSGNGVKKKAFKTINITHIHIDNKQFTFHTHNT